MGSKAGGLLGIPCTQQAGDRASRGRALFDCQLWPSVRQCCSMLCKCPGQLRNLSNVHPVQVIKWRPAVAVVTQARMLVTPSSATRKSSATLVRAQTCAATMHPHPPPPPALRSAMESAALLRCTARPNALITLWCGMRAGPSEALAGVHGSRPALSYAASPAAAAARTPSRLLLSPSLSQPASGGAGRWLAPPAAAQPASSQSQGLRPTDLFGAASSAQLQPLQQEQPVMPDWKLTTASALLASPPGLLQQGHGGSLAAETWGGLPSGNAAGAAAGPVSSGGGVAQQAESGEEDLQLRLSDPEQVQPAAQAEAEAPQEQQWPVIPQMDGAWDAPASTVLPAQPAAALCAVPEAAPRAPPPPRRVVSGLFKPRAAAPQGPHPAQQAGAAAAAASTALTSHGARSVPRGGQPGVQQHPSGPRTQQHAHRQLASPGAAPEGSSFWAAWEILVADMQTDDDALHAMGDDEAEDEFESSSSASGCSDGGSEGQELTGGDGSDAASPVQQLDFGSPVQPLQSKVLLQVGTPCTGLEPSAEQLKEQQREQLLERLLVSPDGSPEQGQQASQSQPQHSEPPVSQQQQKEQQQSEQQASQPQHSQPQESQQQPSQPQHSQPQHSVPQHSQPQHSQPQHSVPQLSQPPASQQQQSEQQHSQQHHSRQQHSQQQHTQQQHNQQAVSQQPDSQLQQNSQHPPPSQQLQAEGPSGPPAAAQHLRPRCSPAGSDSQLSVVGSGVGLGAKRSSGAAGGDSQAHQQQSLPQQSSWQLSQGQGRELGSCDADSRPQDGLDHTAGTTLTGAGSTQSRGSHKGAAGGPATHNAIDNGGDGVGSEPPGDEGDEGAAGSAAPVAAATAAAALRILLRPLQRPPPPAEALASMAELGLLEVGPPWDDCGWAARMCL